MSQTPMLQNINDYLNCNVPLFQAMQARLVCCDETRTSIVAPLAPNINDKAMAFGGSMAALAALTGWAMTRMTLDAHGETGEIVITDSTQKFLCPVRETIITECVQPDLAEVTRFVQCYRQRGKARWTVQVVIRASGEPAMTFTGEYGVFRAVPMTVQS